MSLILDALRKSEAERKRGQVPSLHDGGRRPARAERGWLPVAGAVAALALASGAGWWLLRPAARGPELAAANDGGTVAEPVAGTTPVAAGTPDPAVPLAAAAPASGSLATVALPERESAPVSAASFGGSEAGTPLGVQQEGGGEWPLPPPLADPATASAQPFEAGQAAVQPPPAVEAPAAPMAEPVVATPPPQQVHGLENPGGAPLDQTTYLPPATPAPAPVEPAAPQLPMIWELDFMLRREIPKLNMSMHVWAADPAKRFVLINGKRYPGVDGSSEAIDGEVLIVEIVPDGVICEIRGTRFMLPQH